MKNIIIRSSIILLVLIGFLLGYETQAQSTSKYKATLSGYVKNNWTGEGLFGVNVYIASLKTGTTTDENGYFKLEAPKGTFRVKFSRVDLMEVEQLVDLIEDVTLKIDMKEKVTNLDAVTIYSEEVETQVKSLDVGKSVMKIDKIKKIPAFMGEVDVVKSMILLPGVSTVGEGSSGFNVRGGGVDQNLILQDGAMIFNPSHVFGFFSIFNPAVVNSATLYKSGLSSQYGGRLSSVLDVRLKEGSYTEHSLSGSVGIVTSKLAYDGPLIKNKLALVVGARGSYADWMLGLAKDPDIKNSTASFQDLNLKLTYIANENNKLSYSSYFSNDGFGFASTARFKWNTFNNVVTWHHSFSDRLNLNTDLVNGQYFFDIEDKEDGNDFKVESKIQYNSVKSTLTYDVGEKHKLMTGLEAILYKFNPGLREPIGTSSNVKRLELEQEKSLETGIYVEDDYKVTEHLSIRAGARFSSFTNLGDGRDYIYGDNDTKTVSNIIDTVYYSNNESIAQYQGIEPRLTINYTIGENTSIKASYNRTRQYLHLVSNTTAVTPTDIWKTSNKYIAPEIADQYSIGIFRNLANNSIETSIETYYKESDNIVDFKNGSTLLMNDNVEADLINGTGRAYGMEVSLNKTRGRLTGWMSYTYSRSFRTVKGIYDDETINKGKEYSANYDKPHDFTLAMNYQETPVIEWGFNFTYSTGRPVTEPRTIYNLSGLPNLFSYSNRNAGRIPDYHRLDASITFHSKPKVDRKWRMSWTLAIYNLYGRKNAYSIFYENQYGNPPSAYKLAVLGAPFPSLTVNFKF